MMKQPKTFALGDKLYTLWPYDGQRLIVKLNDKYYVTGKDCEIVGVILREEPLTAK